MASHLNRLDEAILIDDTMYCIKEKNKKKMLKIYIKFSLLSVAMVYHDHPKLKYAMLFSVNRKILIS